MHSSTPEATATRLVLALVGLTAAVRLAAAAGFGLSVDEAYTVVMSRRLAASYFDHPPVMYWITGLASRVAGSEAALAVRLPFIALFAATTLVLFRLGTRLFGARAGLIAALLLNLTPFFTLCAGGWVLPDGPFLFFSVGAALFLVDALWGPPARARRAWLGFGAAAGLSLLSKYHGVFLLAGTAAFLVLAPSKRAWLRRPEPWLAGLVAAAMFSPVLLWNAAHGWASFRFQGSRAAVSSVGTATPLLDSIGGQALWMAPWLWLPLLAALAAAFWRGPRDERRFLLACLAVGPVVTFTLIAASGVKGLPHWPAPGYFFAMPLLGAAVAERLAGGSAWTRRWLLGAALASGLLVMAFGTQAARGWITDLVPEFARHDLTLDLLAWDPVATTLLEQGLTAPGPVIAGGRWTDAARLAHALGPQFTVTSVGNDARGFRFLQPEGDLVGRDVLLVVSRRDRRNEPMVALAPSFERIEALGSVPIRRAGRTEFLVSLYRGHGLRRPFPEAGR